MPRKKKVIALIEYDMTGIHVYYEGQDVPEYFSYSSDFYKKLKHAY